MTSSSQSAPPVRQTAFRALWGFIRDLTATEVRSNLRLLVAPIHALRTGSLEPIKSAWRKADEDSERVFERYLH